MLVVGVGVGRSGGGGGGRWMVGDGRPRHDHPTSPTPKSFDPPISRRHFWTGLYLKTTFGFWSLDLEFRILDLGLVWSLFARTKQWRLYFRFCNFCSLDFA